MRKIKRRSKNSTSSKVDDAMSSVGIEARGTPPVDFLSSGSTTLNLALSGKGKDGGWSRARVDNIVGDGSSGKTLLALELAFWCYKRVKKVKSRIFPRVKKVSIVYASSEGIIDFPLEAMYGKDFVKSVIWKKNKSIEAMGRDYIKRLNELRKGEFLLYIIDSWDALKSTADNTRFAKSVQDDKDIEGSFNLEKQKYTSSFFAYVCSLLERNDKDSTLFIVSQVRTKIGITFGKKTYRAGGKALDFYTHQVAWIREKEKLTKTKLGEKKVFGIKGHVKVERSKVAKPFREADFNILYDYGLDDLGSMVDYLWGKKAIRFKGKFFKTRERFIRYIEKNNEIEEVKKLIEGKWNKIEDAFSLDVKRRKKRY